MEFLYFDPRLPPDRQLGDPLGQGYQQINRILHEHGFADAGQPEFGGQLWIREEPENGVRCVVFWGAIPYEKAGVDYRRCACCVSAHLLSAYDAADGSTTRASHALDRFTEEFSSSVTILARHEGMSYPAAP